MFRFGEENIPIEYCETGQNMYRFFDALHSSTAVFFLLLGFCKFRIEASGPSFETAYNIWKS